jgi:hypothetical protein
MIYMHLLTWVDFGLLGYVPNTLYNYSEAHSLPKTTRKTADMTVGKPPYFAKLLNQWSSFGRLLLYPQEEYHHRNVVAIGLHLLRM